MTKAARRGRPPKGDDALMVPITVRFPPGMMADIEALQAGRADEPEKGQIIRELVAAGLDARKNGRGR